MCFKFQLLSQKIPKILNLNSEILLTRCEGRSLNSMWSIEGNRSSFIVTIVHHLPSDLDSLEIRQKVLRIMHAAKSLLFVQFKKSSFSNLTKM